MLLDLEDEYLRARAQDIQEVCARLIAKINNSSSEYTVLEAGSILVCEHMTTHQISMLETSKIGGIITAGGRRDGPYCDYCKGTRHPIGCRIKRGYKAAKDRGDLLILNGNKGEIICQPNTVQLKKYEIDRKILLEQKRKAF